MATSRTTMWILLTHRYIFSKPRGNHTVMELAKPGNCQWRASGRNIGLRHRQGTLRPQPEHCPRKLDAVLSYPRGKMAHGGFRLSYPALVINTASHTFSLANRTVTELLQQLLFRVVGGVAFGLAIAVAGPPKIRQGRFIGST